MTWGEIANANQLLDMRDIQIWGCPILTMPGVVNNLNLIHQPPNPKEAHRRGGFLCEGGNSSTSRTTRGAKHETHQHGSHRAGRGSNAARRRNSAASQSTRGPSSRGTIRPVETGARRACGIRRLIDRYEAMRYGELRVGYNSPSAGR